MSNYRPECVNWASGEYKGHVLTDELSALRRILESVNRRRTLIRGKLDGEDGKHCAMGCFWADHSRIAVRNTIVDQVAAVNDLLSDRARPKTRWKRVTKWLRDRIEFLESQADRASKP